MDAFPLTAAATWAEQHMLLDAHVVSIPSDLSDYTFACVSQNKPSQQRPILQLALTKLADSD